MSDPQVSWPLEGGYSVSLFRFQDEITEQDVLELWTSEAELPPAEAERRLGELLLVVSGPAGQLAGVSTAYLARSERLLADLWHVRMFTASAHRHRYITSSLSRVVSEHMTERFVNGTERRGIGLLYEIESEILQRALKEGISRFGKFVYIGEDAQGRDIRVRYFPGAVAPEPEGMHRA